MSKGDSECSRCGKDLWLMQEECPRCGATQFAPAKGF